MIYFFINNMEEWNKEIKNCKKIRKNIIINGFSKDEVIVKKNFDTEKQQFKVVDYDYQIELNKTLGIDRKLDKKLKNGNFSIDLKIDFHGLSLEEAFNSLLYNVENAYNNGLRFLLIVTGKGTRTREGKDSIKSQFTTWMKHPNISSKVIKYIEAQKKDGDSGAFYVLLKRK